MFPPSPRSGDGIVAPGVRWFRVLAFPSLLPGGRMSSVEPFRAPPAARARNGSGAGVKLEISVGAMFPGERPLSCSAGTLPHAQGSERVAAGICNARAAVFTSSSWGTALAVASTATGR